jgi:hypothetical protein
MRKRKYHGAGTGPTRKVVKMNNIKTGPTRKRPNTIRINNNSLKKTGPIRKLQPREVQLSPKINNTWNNLPNLEPNLNNNQIWHSKPESSVNMKQQQQQQQQQPQITVSQDRIIIDGRIPTLQELWFEVFAAKRYTDIINHIIAGHPIDISTVPKDEDFMKDINNILVKPSTTKIVTLLKVPGSGRLLVKSLASIGIDSEFSKQLMDTYRQLSADNKVRLIDNLKSYARQYVARPPL